MSNGALFPVDPRAAAVLYLQHGLSPIPMPPRAKDPGYNDWRSLRLTTESIDNYFPRGVAKNIGILNGEPSSSHADVDLDCPEAIAAANILLLETGWQFGRTSTKTSHRIYRTDKPFPNAQERHTDINGKMLVELRGTGGLTVFPPGTHKETGEAIQWDVFTEPADVSLEDLIRGVKGVAAAALIARHWPTTGSRDDASLALSGALIRSGMSEDRASRFIEAVAVAAGDEQVRDRAQKPKGSKQRLEEGKKVYGWTKLAEYLGPQGPQIVARVKEWLGIKTATGSGLDGNTVLSKPKPRIRPIPPYVPFPADLLPQPLREFVKQGSAALGCDAAYVSLPVLATVAGCIGTTRTLFIKSDWLEPSVLWMATIGVSGTQKSPGYKMAVKPLLRVQRKLLNEFKKQYQAYQTELAEYQVKKSAAKRDGGDVGDPPEEPIQPRVMIGDVTIERVAEILEDNPRGVLLGRDELAGWLHSFARYKGKAGGSDRPQWLEMYYAGYLMYDRKTGDRRTISVPMAACSVAGTIQPATIARVMTQEDFETGMAARLLLAYPPRKPKRWRDAEIQADVQKAYAELLEKLLALNFATDEHGEKVPFPVKMTPEAHTRWRRFVDEWGLIQWQTEGDLAAAYSKLEGLAGRFALIYHIVSKVGAKEDDSDPVELGSIEAGIALCHWFARETERIYLILAETSAERELRNLLEFVIAKGNRITVKQLQKSNSRKYRTSEVAEVALQGLVNDSYGHWEPRGVTSKGGRPTKDFVLDFSSDDTDETPDDEAPNSDSENQTPSDETSSRENADPEKHAESEVSSVSSPLRTNDETMPFGTGTQINPEVNAGGVSSDVAADSNGRVIEEPTPTTYVTTPADLARARFACDESGTIAADIETTGLNPRRDRMRLLTLATERGTFIVDTWAVDPSPLWDVLGDKLLIFQNGQFDLGFLARKGFAPGRVVDTMILSKLLHAGTTAKHGLADNALREMGEVLDKQEQNSNWAAPVLTQEQLKYAVRDAEILLPLHQSLMAKIKEAKLEAVADLEHRCLLGLSWLAQSGTLVDRDAWNRLVEQAETDHARLTKRLDELGPPVNGDLGFQGRNWGSPVQVKEAFACLGVTLDSTDDDALSAVDHPLAQTLREHRAAAKLLSSYGKTFLDQVDGDGRVYASWHQCRPASGRMSCSDPNLQQVPRSAYRRCIVAPQGRMLVKADYSQIELRIAAQIAGETNMIAAFKAGEDLHVLTAQRVLGVAEVTKEHRQVAKSINFGLLFGMGVKNFRIYAKANYGVDLTEGQATEYRAKFFKAYPKLQTWHRQTGRTGDNSIETRTLAGRRRLNVTRYSEKLNTPVQGTGADGIKLALGLLWERRDQVPGAFPTMIVHDEIVIECAEAQAEAAAAWLKQAMIDGMQPLLPTVPVEVEIKIGKTWCG